MKLVCTLGGIALLAGVVVTPAAEADPAVWLQEIGDAANLALEEAGSDLRLAYAEYLVAEGDVAAGNTVFFNDVGNKQLAIDFIPGDPRRGWSGPPGADDDITWASDLTQGAAGGLTLAATQTAISNAMATWQGADCSTLPLTNVFAAGDVGFLEALLTDGAAGSFVPAADVVHAGFGSVMDAILPPPIIAATFTLTFAAGDLDSDGLPDLALREIYYTNNFAWATDGGHIDVETVVLHETGHALSQGHFGKLIRTEKNGKFHFAPRAVMNAGYTGIQRSLTGTDHAGHCSLWGSWPNN